MNRREMLTVAGMSLGALVPAGLWAADELPTMQVYKTPTCGCCGKWVEHMRAAGLTVEVTELDDVSPIKRRERLPPQLASCHTAIVGGYVVEGHVPAEDIIRLLKEKPAIKGLVVPGMPIGSPGMEGPNPQRYQTLALKADGSVEVYATHGP